MEIFLAVAVAVVIAALLFFKNSAAKGLEVLDTNKDGKVDLADVKFAVDTAVKGVQQSADVAAVAVKATAKKTVAKAKAVVKKAAPKAAAKRGPKPKQN